MTAEAVVVAARSDGRVDVEISARPCSACAGTCLWRRLQASRLERLPVERPLLPGSEVTVSLSNRRVLTAALMLYGVPLAAILLGAAAGAAATGTDIGTLVGVGFGIAAAAAVSRPMGRSLERLTVAQLLVSPKQ